MSEFLEGTDLLDRIAVIAQQPLAKRADSYVAIHDELARALNSVSTASGN